MRWLIVAVLVAALAWSVNWLLARRSLETRLTAWFAARQEAGWQAAHDGLSIRGFPNRLDARLSEPRLAPPGGAWRWQAPWLGLSALVYRQGRVIVTWPARQSLEIAGREVAIGAGRLRASADLALADGGALRRLVLVGSDITGEVAAARIGAGTMRLALDRQAGDRPVYRVGLAVTEGEGPAMPARLEIDAEATLAAPLRPGRPLPPVTRLRITAAEAAWPSGAGLSASGVLTPDTAGRAEGRLTLTVTEGGGLSAALAPLGLGERALSRLTAEAGGELVLRLAGGRVRLGPVPVAPAPRLAPADQGSNR